MRRNLESRLQAVEAAPAETITGEVWIELRDGMLHGPRGETITQEAFKSVCSRLPFVLVLPDNGRESRP
jgi:hypothetical protein